ncbi:hypothetical protein [Acidiphilium multivorum]|uniref:hypothetical protein n=1 Tax=Acidiphilium multivorum TaxID=62140 RepID=UPI001F4C4070|nr:hypothetical protein [Acidiphilium multivorum]
MLERGGGRAGWWENGGVGAGVAGERGGGKAAVLERGGGRAGWWENGGVGAGVADEIAGWRASGWSGADDG